MSIMVTRSSMPPMDEYIAEIRDIWQDKKLDESDGLYFASDSETIGRR